MKSIAIVVLSLLSLPAAAYIGPGMSTGFIATTLGILGAILLAFVGILYYPIKRLIKGREKKPASSDTIEAEQPPPEDR